MLSLSSELEPSKQNGLYRRLETLFSPNHSRIQIGRRIFVNFSSNNYLGLANHPQVVRKAQSALRRWGAGSGASRLLSGNLKIHEDLERRLADFKREEAALVFSSGYLANLGAVTTLVNEKDVVLVDRLNHASLIDAARLSRAKGWVYPHRDVDELDRLLGRAKGFRRRMVLTDAYFSMEGDLAPLDRIWEICRKRHALLMIDEAHSTGVFGAHGRGAAEHFGLSGKIDVVMGTLSKSLGSVGGFIAGSAELKEYLINRCREFIYTTAPSPGASAAALASLELIERRPSLRARLWENTRFLRNKLSESGFDLMGSEGPVIPLLVGDTGKVLSIKKFLLKEGFWAAAIRPPTVPRGTDRIRLSITASHSKEDLKELAQALKKAKEKFL